MKQNVLNKLTYQFQLVAGAIGLRQLLPTMVRPFAVSLRLSDRCNSRCVTCDCWKRYDGPEISEKQAIHIIDEMRLLGIRAIRFTGGEPLLRQDFFKIVDHCCKDDFDRIVVATNGLLLESLAHRINGSGITHLSVSLDGIGERNDRIRGVPGHYERVIRGLELVKNKRIKIVSTITETLIEDLAELIQFCEERGYAYDINLPHELPYFFSGEAVHDSLSRLWPSKAKIDRILSILEKHRILNKHLLHYAERYLKDRHSDMRHCMHGFGFVDVEPDGSVNPGCYVMPVGNINDTPFGEILRSVPYVEAVRKMYDLKCPGCSCGYALSLMYEHPLAHLGYVRRRMRGPK